MKKLVIFAFLSVFVLSSCSQAQIQNKKVTDLEDAANQVIEILKNKDLEQLAEFVHPNKGVRISPYGYVNVQNDIVLKPMDLNGKFDDDTVYLWGSYDGSGEPIELTFGEYYDKFVYDKDFANSEKFILNEILGTGNTLININEVYPNAEFAEYHFSGFNPEYEGMDWVSLRLVFEKYNDGWVLVGIIHDQWTI
jgi:hypothetical protein